MTAGRSFRHVRAAVDVAQLLADRTRIEHSIWRLFGRYHVCEGRDGPAPDAEFYRRVQPSPEEAA